MTTTAHRLVVRGLTIAAALTLLAPELVPDEFPWTDRPAFTHLAEHQRKTATKPVTSSEDSVFSVQMHVHGSFSEGPGSIDSQTAEAQAAAVDVLWWSDHDHRISSYHLASTFSFESAKEPLYLNESWLPNTIRDLRRSKWIRPFFKGDFQNLDFELTDRLAYEGQRSLFLGATNSNSEFQSLLIKWKADNSRHMRTLASNITLNLAVLPENGGADSQVIVRVGLSYHPANSEVPDFSIYRLRYFFDADATGVPYRDGATYNIPIPYQANTWSVHSLPLTDDALVGFPFLDGRDNRIGSIAIGVESRNNERASAYFDDLQIVHEIDGTEIFAIQSEMLAVAQANYPEVKQLQGTEISYLQPHLNEFTEDTELSDYDDLVDLSGLADANGMVQDLAAFEQFINDYVVDAAHQKGGLISLNHMFGAGPGSKFDGSKEELRDELLGNNAYRADILEVGYRERVGWLLSDYLWVWDELAREGLVLIGSGVSDSHGGHSGHWLYTTNNFVSWIYSPSPSKPDLIAGMKSGRMFFGDIVQFDGTVDISTSEGFRMGDLVVTEQDEFAVTFSVEGLVAGDEIRLIESGELVQILVADGPSMEISRIVSVDPTSVSFARLEAYTATGKAKVFSNPIYFSRPENAANLKRHSSCAPRADAGSLDRPSPSCRARRSAK